VFDRVRNDIFARFHASRAAAVASAAASGDDDDGDGESTIITSESEKKTSNARAVVPRVGGAALSPGHDDGHEHEDGEADPAMHPHNDGADDDFDDDGGAGSRGRGKWPACSDYGIVRIITLHTQM
jgi:hypothetical protein